MPSYKRKTVLFMTISSAGHSNSILALSLELLTYPNIDVHVASFPPLRKRAQGLSSSVKVLGEKHPSSNFMFHEIGGMNEIEAIESKGLRVASFPHPPLARSHDEGIYKLLILLSPWNGKGTHCHLHFALLVQVENQLLTEMAVVALRICQSGRQLQRHYQHG
jgi:hypothetical protein